MDELKVEMMTIDDLIPYEDNTKLHDEPQIEKIKNSITRFGFNDPIAIDEKSKIIIAGHGRYLAAVELNLGTVPTIKLGHLSEEKRRLYAIAHNKLTANTGFDKAMLVSEFVLLQEAGFAIDMTGFGLEEAEETIASMERADSGFLDEFFDDDEEDDTESVVIRGERFFKLPYKSTWEERQIVLKAVLQAKKHWILKDSSSAMLQICKDFLTPKSR